MDRSRWRELADRWLADAKTLLDAKRWSAAYYAAGYAVECGLKACVLARVADSPELIFDDRRFSERCWTHNLLELVKLAGLEADRVADGESSRQLGQNWLIVVRWAETARYEERSHHQAKRLYRAIADEPNGVLQWLKARW